MDNSDCRVAHKPHRAPLRWILAVKFHTKRRGTVLEGVPLKAVNLTAENGELKLQFAED